MTALMVCMRFSASSKTLDCLDSKTSSATSISVMPNCSAFWAPMVVLVSWKLGRQCRKIASFLSVAHDLLGHAVGLEQFLMRSPQTSSGSPMDTHTSA